MRLLEWARGHVFVVAALVGALAGMVVGLFLPIRAALPAKGEALEWKLPPATAVRRFNEENFAVVLGASYLGQRAPGAPRGQRPSEGVTAILTSPRVCSRECAGLECRNALEPARWRAAGGAILLAANRDTIWFEKDGCAEAHAAPRGRPR